MRTLRIAAIATLMMISLVVLGTPAEATFPGADLWIYWVSDRTGHAEIWNGAWGVGHARDTWEGTDHRRPCMEPGTYNFAFDSLRRGDREIYWFDTNHGTETALTHNKVSDVGPSYSPTGAKIVFTSTRTGSAELWTMLADGSRQRQLTSTTGLDGNPDWSPDGKRIAFYHKGGGDPAGIYTITPRGKGMKLVSKGSNLPSWSPDGTQLAVTRVAGSYSQVFKMDADGSNLTQLTILSQGATAPAWSPSGTQIAFAGRTASNTDVYTMHTDGTVQSPFVGQDPTGMDTEPVWTP